MRKPFAFCVHAALALAAVPFTAAAADSVLDYSYLELGYTGVVGSELNGLAINGSIEVGEAWFVFGRYGRASRSRGSAEDFGAGNSTSPVYDDFERASASIGLGYRRRLAPWVDFVARVSYDRLNFEQRYVNSRGFSGDYDGRFDSGGLEAGVRGLASDRLEIWVYGGVSQIIDADFDVLLAAYPRDFIDIRCFEDPDECFDEEALEAILEDDVDYELQPYARVGALYQFTDTWGLTTAAKLNGGGSISYFAGIRASF